jgi:hypothetical protein
MVKQLIITCSLVCFYSMSYFETIQVEVPGIAAAVLQQLNKDNITKVTTLLSDEALQKLSDEERAQLQAELTALLMKKAEAKDEATTWGNKLTNTAGILSGTCTVLGITGGIFCLVNILKALNYTGYLDDEDDPISRQIKAIQNEKGKRAIVSGFGAAACIIANAFITPSLLAIAMYKNHKASKLRTDKRMLAALLARLQQPAQQA